MPARLALVAPLAALALVGGVGIQRGRLLPQARARALTLRAALRLGPSAAEGGAPVAAPALVGFENFVRTNPRSDRFEVLGLDHLEFYCADATTTCARFLNALDMELVGRLDAGGARSLCAQSGNVRFVFTAPTATSPGAEGAPLGFDAACARDFVEAHGLGVRAIAIHVADAVAAYDACVANGGAGVRQPQAREGVAGARVTSAEVALYGNVVLRLLSTSGSAGEATEPLALLPGYAPVDEPGAQLPGARATPPLIRVDHVVGNVPSLTEPWGRIARMTGFHEFAEFTAEDVGTVDSGLNSVVLASNSETVLLPINEPTHGTRRVSQIQTYLDAHGGPGVQHIALFTPDIFSTVREMRARTPRGGFAFMPRPSSAYYAELAERLGLGASDAPLTAAELAEAEELGILVDRDDQGVLLQIFTTPVGDRPTLFIEIIQRLGCEDEGGAAAVGGCGGFGKGNFRELFKSVEDFLADAEAA